MISVWKDNVSFLHPFDVELVRAINEIGHVLGKKTIAEFVENQQIFDKLKVIGVDYAQGYGRATQADRGNAKSFKPIIVASTLSAIFAVMKSCKQHMCSL